MSDFRATTKKRRANAIPRQPLAMGLFPTAVCLAVACVLLLLPGCRSPLQPPTHENDASGMGTLSLAVNGQGVGRTISPDLDNNVFATLRLSFSSQTSDPVIEYVDDWTLGGPLDPIQLPAGTWDLTVTAYVDGIPGDDTRAAIGTLGDIAVVVGGNATGNVVLHLIDNEGTGTFAWNIRFPGSVAMASMEVLSLLHDSVHGSPNLIIEGESFLSLDSGRYRVTIVLYIAPGNPEKRASLSTILHVYRNMTSHFDREFTYRHFPFTLNRILAAWGNPTPGEWNFAHHGILPEHFGLLDIVGIDQGNFGDITDWFNQLTTAANVPETPEDMDALVDAALVNMARPDIIAGDFANQTEAQAAILALVPNTPTNYVRFAWRNGGGVVDVSIGAVERPGMVRVVEIVFDNPIADIGTLAGWLAWLRTNARDGGNYRFEMSADEDISPAEASLAVFAGSGITITLASDGAAREVRLSENGSLFTVPAGVTLTLDGGVTLVGRGAGGNGGEDNDAALVTVNGTLEMLDGSAITGNTNVVTNGDWGFDRFGGGVRVNSDGVFVMHGGRIFGNRTISTGMNAGGVFVARGGTFDMHDGEIFGNESGGSPGGVYAGGTFNMRGGVIFGNRAGPAGWGGGVSVSRDIYGGIGGLFRMSGGIIYGNEAYLPQERRNSAGGGRASLNVQGVRENQANDVAGVARYGTFAPGGDFTMIGFLVYEDRTIEVVNGVLIRPRPDPPVIEMVPISGGTFLMGSPVNTPNSYPNERPVRQVTLSGFYMSRFQVTQGEWYDVMFDLPGAGVGTRRPSVFNGTNNNAGATVTPTFEWRNLPVERVSWYDALVFSNRLSIQRGLTPAYSIDGSTNPDDWGTVPTVNDPIWNAVTIVPDSTGYRLPTDAQWEFAARGGNGSPGNYTFSGSNVATEVAWHNANSENRTREVGTLAPNALGLYDMSGNVWEWVWDWFDDYPDFAQTDPLGASSGSTRVLRGGSWTNAYPAVRSARRHHEDPATRSSIFGLRLARPIPESGTAGDPFLLDAADFLRRAQANPPDWPLSGHFRLTQDIDLAALGITQWTPIGNAASPFTGSFDGGGHSISGLTIPGATGDNQGMFGVIGSGAVVRDLDLAGVSINVTGNSVGALAGRNYGTVDNVSVSGSVTGGDNVIGGIVGSNRGAGSRLANSSSAADVSGVQQVGGLAGTNAVGGIVENSFATGRIFGSGGHAGGAVGRNESTVRSSFALGDVSGGGNNVGGLVGNNVGGAVENSFAVGDVTSSANNVGGLVGANFNGGAVENSFAAGSVSGGVRVGGIVGGNYAGSWVINSAALGPSAIGTAAASRARAAGQNDAGATLANNHANAGMLVGAPSAVVTAGLVPATVQGASVSPGTGAGQWNNQAWWTSAAPSGPGFQFYPAGPWRWCPHRLRPTLPGEPFASGMATFNITLAPFLDPALNLDILGPTIRLRYGGSVNVNNAASFGSIRWLIGARLLGTGPTLALDSTIHGDRIGTHRITVEALLNGSWFSKTVSFEVRP